jgi:hypothetical protein
MANGIPPLLNQIASVSNPVSLLVADAANLLAFFAGPQWGVFNLDGSIALQPDSILALDFKREWSIPNYPVEQGGFQTYNKISLPSDTNISMSKGGSNVTRQAFLLQVSALAKSLTTVNVMMPEGTLIRNVNILRFDFRRTDTSGVGLLTVDILLREIRDTATAAFSNTQQPSGANPVNDGSVQPQTPTTSQSAAASAFQ